MSLDSDFIQGLRVQYKKDSLSEKDCGSDPLKFFERWFDEAVKSRCDEPNAFTLSTIKDGRPRSRVVLFKGLWNQNLVFYTNYQSAKGEELASEASVAVNFLWLPLQRQVRIEGKVVKVPKNVSDDYFQKRPRGSQLGAVASPQSQKIQRGKLEESFFSAEKKYPKEILRPENWGGYGIAPTYYEFWQGRENRLHDRIVFENKNQVWDIFRIAP